MNSVQVLAADFDYNTPLVLEFNEITSLMAISTVGIITIMALCIAVAATSFFSNKGQDLTQEHYTRR